LDNLASEFQRLCDRRDLAAYHVAAVVQIVISFFESQNYEDALAMLKRAKSDFDVASKQIEEFLKSNFPNSTKENKTDGNRTAA
jgi:hypothetical protein